MPRRGYDKAVGILVLGAIAATASILLRPAPSPTSGSTADLAPGFLARKERWGTKTGVGDDAPKIDVAHPQIATVADLTALPRPEGLPERGGPGSDRFGPVEHTAFTIDAKLLRYKWEEEDDGDYHVVITDYASPGPTMIVEIPDPRAVDPSSPWRERIGKARAVFDAAFHPVGRFTRRTAHIRVTGIGFFDFLHGQSGVAPNGIELHPVIKVEVLD
jgi:hypothetical protein